MIFNQGVVFVTRDYIYFPIQRWCPEGMNDVSAGELEFSALPDRKPDFVDGVYWPGAPREMVCDMQPELLTSNSIRRPEVAVTF